MLRQKIALISVFASACSAPGPVDGDGWKQVGGLDKDMIPFVAISPERARDGAVYRDAIDRLCGTRRCVQVGFFLAGDRMPQSGPRSDFFRAGGWSNYSPLAVYMGGEFTKWDCERAGEESAPLSALCGERIGEEYGAILGLATRDGWVKGCGLSPFGGKELVERYVATLQTERRAQMLSAYQEMFASAQNGPDNPSDCQALRSKIEQRGRHSKKVIESALSRNTQQSKRH